MSTQGVSTMSAEQTAFGDLIYYLNPKAPILTPYKDFVVEKISPEELRILLAVLNKTDRERVNIQGAIQLNIVKTPSDQTLHLVIDTIDEQSGFLLILWIKNASFTNITLQIKNIAETTTLEILKAIAENGHTQKINIQIPDYVVDNLGALQNFLASLTETKKSGVDADFEEFGKELEKLWLSSKEKLQQASTHVAASATAWYERGKPLLNQYATQAWAALGSLADEEEPRPNSSPRMQS